MWVQFLCFCHNSFKRQYPWIQIIIMAITNNYNQNIGRGQYKQHIYYIVYCIQLHDLLLSHLQGCLGSELLPCVRERNNRFDQFAVVVKIKNFVVVGIF